MQFYPKPSEALVYDLVNAANPALPIALTPAVARLESPKAIANAVGNALNSTIVVSANRNQGYRGTKVLNYRRIDLGNFFKNTTVIINKYKPVGAVLKFSDFLDDFNRQYGFVLTDKDFTDVTLPAATIDPVDNRRTSTTTVVTKTDSLGFIGSFTFKWKEANQELGLLITKPELNTRVYPASNFVNLMTYGGDNTETMTTPTAVSNGQLYAMFDFFSTGLVLGAANRADLYPGHQEFAHRISASYGINFFVDKDRPMSDVGNLFGTVMELAQIPNASYPTANSNDFKRLFVLKLQPEHTWGSGNLFFHHNYGT